MLEHLVALPLLQEAVVAQQLQARTPVVSLCEPGLMYSLHSFVFCCFFSAKRAPHANTAAEASGAGFLIPASLQNMCRQHERVPGHGRDAKAAATAWSACSQAPCKRVTHVDAATNLKSLNPKQAPTLALTPSFRKRPSRFHCT